MTLSLRVLAPDKSVFDGDADDVESVRPLRGTELDEFGDLDPARAAPARPEVHDGRPALPLGEAICS